MDKKIPIKRAGILIVAAVLSTLAVICIVFLLMGGAQRMPLYAKINEVMEIIDNDYLFDTDNKKLMDYMSTGLIAGLEDDYSRYLSDESYKRKLESDAGEFVGIGVQIDLTSNAPYLTVAEVYENSPSSESGVLAGDIIKAVDGKDLAELAAENIDATTLIMGKVGTTVTLEIERAGESVDIVITRREVEVPSVVHKLIGELSYIKILDFNDNTFDQFKTAVDSAALDNARGIIFDLRDNGGGSMDTAIKMLDYVCPSGVLATTTDKNGKETVYADSDDNEINLPMVTIGNGSTASAAELFVATLKDFDKAKMVGSKTYGKGIMQTTYKTSGNSAVKLTTAYFNPPKSENFHKKGIEPDYPIALSDDEVEELQLGDEHSDKQLQKAIEVVLLD